MKSKIFLFSFPLPSALLVNRHLYSLVDILKPSCNTIILVTGNVPKDVESNGIIKVKEIRPVLHQRRSIRPLCWSNLLQVGKIVIIQMKMCLTLIKHSGEARTALFYAGGYLLLPPVVVAKLLRKNIIIAALGSGARSNKEAGANSVIFTIFSFLERQTFALSDCVLVESQAVVRDLRLERYRAKITTKGARYVDTTHFRPLKPLNERINCVGFIGRLSEEKGILDLAHAIPYALRASDELSFLIGGTGHLFTTVQSYFVERGINKKIEMVGWIPREQLPSYLNQLKLLILPSHTEGLPTIVLEAMACGTPVVATPVGGVPDIIKDEETGFIIKERSPQGIAAAILQTLTRPDVEDVALRARAFIERHYDYDSAVRRYAEVLEGKL